MRTITVAVCLLGALGASMARAADDPSSSFPDRSKAFAGVAFGASLEQARQQWQLEEAEGASVPDDPVKVYLREEESHIFGGVRVREVIYYFLRDRFYAVGFATPDTRQTAILREALELGDGAKPHADGAGRSLVWPGAAVSAQLVVDGATGEGRLLFFSNELQPEYEQTLREAAAKTAAGLSGAPDPSGEPSM
jgi:hypothetical protein